MAPPIEILILQGPNLNLLGQREPEIYGHQTLNDIHTGLTKLASQLEKEIGKAIRLQFFQSNHEGDLIDQIHQARNSTQGLIFNPGGFTHTSVAIRDALSAYSHPIIEVHLSNIHQRETFRHHSFVSGVATGVICGLGAIGYELALRSLLDRLKTT